MTTFLGGPHTIIKPELEAILRRYGIDPYDETKLWEAHGVLVLYHTAFELIARKENVYWDTPHVLEAKTTGEDMSVAILVVGSIAGGDGDRRAEWSVGEVNPSNYRLTGKQQGYPYAMAEKRGKDRVIAKLVGLSEFLFSEEESDEFRQHKEPPHPPAPPTTPPPAPPQSSPRAAEDRAWPVPRDAQEWIAWQQELQTAVGECMNGGDLKRLWQRNSAALDNAKERYSAMYASIKEVFTAQHLKIGRP